MKNSVDIVLLHGWGCDHTIWNSLHRHLEEFLTATDFVAPPAPPLGDATEVSQKPQTSRIFALDFPGFGSEPEPETPWNIEDYVQWFEQYTAQRDITNPVLVGHSFGGRVAIVYASRNPVSKVVLVDAAGVKPRRKIGYYIKVWSFKALRRIAPLLLGRERAARLIEARRKASGSADYAAASPVMRATLSRVVNEDLRRFMPLIKAPTLLVWGSEDTATPIADARVMERLIPDAGLVTFSGAGHYSFLERPAQFNAVLDSFLNS